MDGATDPAFDLSQLAMGAGAGFVARSTSYDFNELRGFMKRALLHSGFSVVEVMTACPTYFGRLNEMREPYDMLLYLRDSTEPVSEHVESGIKASHSRLPTGVFREQVRPEFTEVYASRMAAMSEKERAR